MAAFTDSGRQLPQSGLRFAATKQHREASVEAIRSPIIEMVD